jgi:hypothetical protein
MGGRETSVFLPHFYFGKNDVNIVAKTPSKIINPTPISPRLTQVDDSVMSMLICLVF